MSYTDEQFIDAGSSVEIAQNESVRLLKASVALETTASGCADIIHARPRTFALSVERRF